MNSSEKTINQLYTSIANGDIKKINECYSPITKFHDPIFGTLNNNEVPKMWEMLITKSKGKLEIEYNIIKTDNRTASVQWTAIYTFGKKQREIKNVIHSQFQFKEGLIIKQKDDFNIWTWLDSLYAAKNSR